MNNLCITGSQQVGKSYLINQLIYHLNLSCHGFQTSSPIQFDRECYGYQLHSLCPVFDNDQIIMKITGEQRELFPAVFDDLGVRALESVTANIVVFDELGRIEKDSYLFQQLVKDFFERDVIVLSVLKKEEIDWIAPLKHRADTIYIDLDDTPYDRAFTTIRLWLEALLPSQ
ncbi:nucleoside-triphosphatase (plasmid) [Entomospira entomophila]|uniref:NTPase n=1 Tax=Entomospira entomophila TaxID=2719988 RepID=A0A968KTD7_9SPIO|nr:nucleoside-triphosphatase [Entomospira entomophilus]NIZ41327.1 hypothetical protein [Entomospira entomophilus]WDI36261.1 nucleoside-triphosphatase [Entomospira entomophilus]